MNRETVLVFRHVPHEGLGTIGQFFLSAGVQVEYCDLFNFIHGKFPEQPEDYDYVVSMGGPMNADEVERYPFLLMEREFLRKAINQNVPTFGICLGAQIIARALGARVYTGERKEIGWFPIELTSEGKQDAMFGQFKQNRFTVFQWHGDTFNLPKGATLLASSPAFKHQAFKFGSCHAFQFHIEVTQEMIQSWIAHGESELKSLAAYVSPVQILSDTKQLESSLAQTAHQIYPALFSNLKQRASV